MKLGDPVIIGYPARGEPLVLGTLAGHGLPEDLLIGTTVEIRGRLFTVNVSYIPDNPKREKLVTLLVPKEKMEDDFWTGSAKRVEPEKPKVPPKQEEFPF
jgi:hypothetical protein